MGTMAEFCRANGITAVVEAASSNPNIDAANWDKGAQHWRFTLHMGRRSMVVPYTAGSGLRGSVPTLADVLDCLASDAFAVEDSGDFEGWCADLGFDTDSRKAERIYNAALRQSLRLRHFLGAGLYDVLLYHTEIEPVAGRVA